MCALAFLVRAVQIGYALFLALLCLILFGFLETEPHTKWDELL